MFVFWRADTSLSLPQYNYVQSTRKRNLHKNESVSIARAGQNQEITTICSRELSFQYFMTGRDRQLEQHPSTSKRSAIYQKSAKRSSLITSYHPVVECGGLQPWRRSMNAKIMLVFSRTRKSGSILLSGMARSASPSGSFRTVLHISKRCRGWQDLGSFPKNLTMRDM